MSWLLRIASILALLAFSGAIWLAGPLVGFAETRPLAGILPRAAIIGAIWFVVVLGYLVVWLRGRSAQKALERAIVVPGVVDGEAALLDARMQEAVETLKRTGAKRNFLYELPWYMIIGPPGVGKTTALVNSGLKFPLVVSGKAQPIPGVGGTRNCDWWFTEDAVLIDTAGRYTMQESDAEADRKGWLSFLDVLRRHRPRQPINGVIVAVSLADMMTQSDEVRLSHQRAIKARLKEMQASLGVDLPVYVLFTKADLISGFMQYFATFDPERRQRVWGMTFQDMASNAAHAGSATVEYDGLVRRLAEELPDLMQEEADPEARLLMFGFPAQFRALGDRLHGFVAGIFNAPESPASTTLRGIYFSSGTQEGTPFDQLLGAVARRFGRGSASQMSGKGKSFFLHDLLRKVIFAEAGWVSRDRAAERRRQIARVAGIAAVGVVTLGALATFGLSFASNGALITSTQAQLDHYREVAQPIIDMPVVADSELENVVEPLAALRKLPVGYERGEAGPLVEKGLGLGQRERLASAARTAYQQALERMFRSRLLLQTEQTLQVRLSNPETLYEPLKVYLMLTGQAPKVDDELVVAWFRKDWERRYPGSQNREGRQELENHLRAMLVLDDDQNPVFEPDRALVEAARRSLGQMTVTDRAAAVLVSAKASIHLPVFSLASASGPEAPIVFEATDGGGLERIRVPGLYTYAGFNDFYLPALADVSRQLDEDRWVIGEGAELGTVEQDLLKLGPALLDLYSKEFVTAWNGALDRVNFKPLSSDKPRYVALSAIAAPSSPIKQLLEAIARETALTTRRVDASLQAPDEASQQALADGLAKLGIDLPSGKSQIRAGDTLGQPTGQIPGAAIEAQFRPFQLLVAGRAGQRPVDVIVQNFHEIYQTLLSSAAAPNQGQRANVNLSLQLSSLRANASRLPDAVSRLVLSAADDLEGDVAETTIAQLNQQLEDTVREACEAVVANRFPFSAGSSDDVAMDEFSRLFAPGGLLDRFFAQNVAAFVDMGGTNWEWKQGSRIGRELSKSTLRQFQAAAEIRDAFFPLGGSVPAVNVTFTPFSLNRDADQALLDVNGQIVQSFQTGSSPAMVTWPGAISGGSAHLSLTPELPGRESSMAFNGSWALKRLLDAGEVKPSGEKLDVRFVIGGRDVAYTVQVNSAVNPFTLRALADFSCPISF